MKYGGGDLTFALWNLMIQSGVPFKIDLNCLWDITFLSELKEELCHFDLDRCGPEEHTVLWDKPGETVVRYNILIADELLVVPLSYFNPDLLRGSVASKSICIHKPGPFVHDDPFDSIFISETAVSKLLRMRTSMLFFRHNVLVFTSYQRRALKETESGEVEEDGDIEDSKDIDTSIDSKKIDTDQLLGIDQAILQSIESYSKH